MEDEDSIDLEALQAQIDMSMAFAEEMVSSWMKSSRKLSSRSNRDPEAELKEYMHRPPRLGVGAAIPETASSSRDVARLKGRLTGKGNKRPRGDELDSKEKDDTDSEAEIRGGVLKKKARVDPFSNDGKKKKKHKAAPESAPLVSEPSAPEEMEKEGLEEAVNLVTECIVAPSAPFVTPKHKKHKKNHATTESSLGVVQTHASPVSHQMPLNTSPSIPPNNQQQKVVRVPMTTTPATLPQLHRQAPPAALLKFPLLNLTPANDDSEHEDDAKSDARNTSPKKKRKRKKKKKKGGASTLTASEVPPALS
ncbi:hypothetical protein C0995_005481 [Termitomyces sp. Mi166|nr:hypothetical protein C0995_005481 [Termitomyces sp. Mi166\